MILLLVSLLVMRTSVDGASLAGNGMKSRKGADDAEDSDCTKDKSLTIVQKLVGACIGDEGHGLETWFLICVSISILFLVKTLIVYSVIPEMKNVRGSIFRWYLASHVCCMISSTMALSLSQSQSEPPNADLKTFITIIELAFVYFGLVSMFWLTVMTLDIWRRWRDVNDLKVEERQRNMFRWYLIYTWGSALVCMLWILVLAVVAESLIGTFMMKYSWIYLPAFWITCIDICNVCLHISTASTVKKREEKAAHLVDGVNKYEEENKEWFDLCLKLFLVMKVPLMFWAIGIFARNTTFWKIVFTVEALRGIFVFFIFVWKDDVKRSFCKRFNEMVKRVSNCIRRYDSTRKGSELKHSEKTLQKWDSL